MIPAQIESRHISTEFKEFKDSLYVRPLRGVEETKDKSSKKKSTENEQKDAKDYSKYGYQIDGILINPPWNLRK